MASRDITSVARHTVINVSSGNVAITKDGGMWDLAEIINKMCPF